MLNPNRDVYLITPFAELDVVGESLSLDLFCLVAQAWPWCWRKIFLHTSLSFGSTAEVKTERSDTEKASVTCSCVVSAMMIRVIKES